MFVDPYVIFRWMENSKNLQSGNTTMDVVSRILGNAVYAFTRGDYQPFFFIYDSAITTSTWKSLSDQASVKEKL